MIKINLIYERLLILLDLWYNKGEHKRIKFVIFLIVLVYKYFDYLLIKIKKYVV